MHPGHFATALLTERHVDGAAMSLSDGQLLEHFLATREQAAFAKLVERHGAMVLGTCRRVLNDEHDAEDAFQATFLILAKNGGRVRKRESVASWLYGVAYRVARRLKCSAGQRRVKEQHQAAMLTPERIHGDLLSAVAWREVRPVLDEELAQLPAKYRAPLVLCYLEGKTHEAAARELGWSKGSMSRRLEKARELLRRRLTRRGITLSAGIIFGVLATHGAAVAVPPALAAATTSAATALLAGTTLSVGIVSARAAQLAEGVMHTMFLARVQGLVASAIVAVMFIGTSVGAWTYVAAGRENQSARDGHAGTTSMQTFQGPTRAEGTPDAGGGTRVARSGKSLDDPANPASGAAVAAAPQAPDPVVALQNRQLRKLLAEPTDKLAKGIDPGTPFKDALEFLRTAHGMPILIDYAAFNTRMAMSPDQVNELRVSLEPMKSVPLAHALDQILGKLEGNAGEPNEGPMAAYVVRGGQIVVRPASMVRFDDLMRGDPNFVPESLREPVTLAQEDRPLQEVLKELAEATGANIVLDVRARDQAQNGVTANVQQVPLETAVQLLADMAELKAIVVDNVIYVTTVENAERMLKDRQEKLRNGLGS